MSNEELKVICNQTAEAHLRMVRKTQSKSLIIIDLKVGNVNVSYDANTRTYTIRALGTITTNTRTGETTINAETYLVATAKATKNWLAENYVIETIQA